MEQIKKYLKDNYISKTKINEKILDLYREIEQINISEHIKFDSRIYINQTKIKVLKELLQENMEEDNYKHIPHID